MIRKTSEVAVKNISLCIMFFGLICPCYPSLADINPKKTDTDSPNPSSVQPPKKTDTDSPNPSSVQPPKKTDNDSPNPSSVQKLRDKFIGSWETTDEKSGQVLRFTFKQDGKLEYVTEESDGSTISRKADYEFDPKRDYAIKLTTSGRVTQTLYQFSPDGNELQIQLIGQRPNRPYPPKFDPTKSRKFTKVKQ